MATGSLLGKADSTLVQGAFRSEMANVGRDMGGVYAMQAENVKNFQTALSNVFYAMNKSNNELTAEVKELSSQVLSNIESGTYSDDVSIDLYTNAINDLRNEMKSIPRGKEGEAQRSKIKARLARMKTDTANAEKTITELATLYENNQISQYAVNEGDLKLFKDILKGDAKREIVNGELVYSTVDENNNPVKINHNELSKRFVPKDYVAESNKAKLDNEIFKLGQTSGATFNVVEAANMYEKNMPTKDGFLHLINTPVGGSTHSYKQALVGQDKMLVGQLIEGLNSIGGFDFDQDGKFDKITEENIKKYVGALTSPTTQQLPNAKRAAAAFYAVTDGQFQFNKGRGILNAKQDKLSNKASSKGFYMINRQNVAKSDIDPTVALLNSDKDYPKDTAWNGVIHKKENGKYFQFVNGDYVEKSRDSIAAAIGVMSDRYGYQRANNNTQAKNKILEVDFDFIKMNEESAEEYLKENLPEGFTFEQYGIGDAITVMYGNESVNINLQPNTTSGEKSNIKKLNNFIKKQFENNDFAK